MTSPMGRTAGFSLIESLVALAVLALMAVALLGATEAHIVRIGGLETRAVAGWAAENHLALLRLGESPEPGIAMLGRSFSMTAESRPTSDPGIVQVTVTATDSDTGQAYGGYAGFLDSGAAR